MEQVEQKGMRRLQDTQMPEEARNVPDRQIRQVLLGAQERQLVRLLLHGRQPVLLGSR